MSPARSAKTIFMQMAGPLLVLLMLAALAPQLRADTIYLKNGKTIVAESITDTGDKIYYEGEYGRVSIPKSIVDRVEKGGAMPVRRLPSLPSGTEPERDPAELPPAIRLRLDPSQMQRIVKDGVVDDRFLAELASKAGDGDAERKIAVNGFLLAAVYEAREDHMSEASRWADEALRVDSYDRNALLLASQIALSLHNYNAALQHMLVAYGNEPESPDVLTLLGDAYYFSQGPDRAVRYWKLAEEQRPDPKLKDRIQRAEKEAEVESGLAQAESYHFILNWEGSRLPAFGEQVLNSLEQSFREVEVALDYSPREPIIVILYGSQQFADITRSPGWAGAVNDGKIRVPVQGLTSLTFELAQILKHEMTHSFIHQITAGRCPTWLNEGMAQMEAGESFDDYGSQIAQRYAASKQVPLLQLEGSFRRFTTGQALLGYAESLLTVQMIRDQYGDYYLTGLLRGLGKGQTMAATIKSVLRIDYPELETELAAYIARRYGK